MRFRVGTILWAFALLAAALATFGLFGVFAAFSVVWFWFLVFKGSPSTLIKLLITIVILSAMVGYLLPPSEPTRRMSGERCRQKLDNLGKAITQYDEENQGLPMDNWRTLLLPYVLTTGSSDHIDQDQDSQAAVRKSSPALSSIAPYEYTCSSDHSSIKHGTSYFAVIDAQCAWKGVIENKLADITDNPTQTILILEAHNQNVAWTESKNLSFDEAVALLSDPSKQANSCHWREGAFLDKPTWVRNVLFADGTVRSLNMPLPTRLAMALLTADGGEQIDMLQLERLSKPELDYRKVYSLSVFVALSLLPIVNLRRKQRTQT